MSDYLITGKKGNGKSIFAVGVILDALTAKKRVATNMNIFLDKLTHPYAHCSLVRLPDVPTAHDLHLLGRGQEGVVEENNGVIVIDEASKILNSRDWSDKQKQRSPLLDWLVHSRKLGWDVYLIAQGISQLDAQVRKNLLEYSISIFRTDKWRLPIIGSLGKLRPSGKPFTLPKMSVGTIRQGFSNDSMICDRKYYRGPPLYSAYETQQLFLDSSDPLACGIHTVLPPWYTHGRYLPPRKKPLLQMVKAWANGDYLPVKPPRLPKKRLIELVMRLPPDQRIGHVNRLISLGAI